MKGEVNSSRSEISRQCKIHIYVHRNINVYMKLDKMSALSFTAWISRWS